MIKPSDLHPDLTQERIDIIGHLIARVRLENIESADERDDGWSLGCRAYKWCCSEIIELSKTTPWLEIINPSLKFIFTVGNVEVSFYKGVAENPKKNISNRAQYYPELRQLSILPNIEIPEKLFWAFAVETDVEGITTSIEFFAMSEDSEVISAHNVPLQNVVRTLYAVKTSESAPVDIPAATVTLPGVGNTKKVETMKRRRDD